LRSTRLAQKQSLHVNRPNKEVGDHFLVGTCGRRDRRVTSQFLTAFASGPPALVGGTQKTMVFSHCGALIAMGGTDGRVRPASASRLTQRARNANGRLRPGFPALPPLPVQVHLVPYPAVKDERQIVPTTVADVDDLAFSPDDTKLAVATASSVAVYHTNSCEVPLLVVTSAGLRLPAPIRFRRCACVKQPPVGTLLQCGRSRTVTVCHARRCCPQAGAECGRPAGDGPADGAGHHKQEAKVRDVAGHLDAERQQARRGAAVPGPRQCPQRQVRPGTPGRAWRGGRPADARAGAGGRGSSAQPAQPVGGAGLCGRRLRLRRPRLGRGPRPAARAPPP